MIPEGTIFLSEAIYSTLALCLQRANMYFLVMISPSNIRPFILRWNCLVICSLVQVWGPPGSPLSSSDPISVPNFCLSTFLPPCSGSAHSKINMSQDCHRIEWFYLQLNFLFIPESAVCTKCCTLCESSYLIKVTCRTMMGRAQGQEKKFWNKHSLQLPANSGPGSLLHA